jgi:hypothetical protein
VDEAPNLVALKPLAGEHPHAHVHVLRAGAADVEQELEQRGLRHAGDPHRPADGDAIHQALQDSDPFGTGELVHGAGSIL